MNKRELSWTRNIIELKEFQKGYKQVRNSEIHTILKKNKTGQMSQVRTRLKLVLSFLDDVKHAYMEREDREINKIENAINDIEDFLLLHDFKYDK